MAKLKQKRRKKRDIWDEAMILKARDYARAGMADTAIAQALGVAPATLTRLRDAHPGLELAITEGRSQSGGVETFKEYVYERLSPDLQQVWEQVVELNKDRNGVARVEALLARHGTKVRQHLFVHALVSGNFNPSDACAMVNVPKRTLDGWTQRDPDFAALVDEIHWHKRNFFEGALFAAAARGETAAIVFANKTLNADRGYQNTLKVEGTVNHQHEHVVRLDDLKLPLDVRKSILAAMRAAEAKEVDGEVVDMPALPAKGD